MNKGEYLESTLKTYKISKEEALLAKFKERNQQVKDDLKTEYKDKLYQPFNSGSYAKHTAINTRFDFDLIAPFKKNAFGSNGTLEDTYTKTHDFLYGKYSSVATIRKQRVSIGIIFNTDNDGDKVCIDVVPGRELNQDTHENDKDLNLYVYKRYGEIEEGSDYIKTNIHAQIDNIRETTDKDKIRKIIRLLKVWKTTKHDSPVKSFFIELAVIRAFDKNDITGNLWDNLKVVMEYLKNEVVKDSFTLIDPGNSNNDVAITLNKNEKQWFSDDLSNILNRIEENDENIKTFFPKNEKFEEEDGNDNNTNAFSYGVAGSTFTPTPPKTDRFG
ncbi:MAG: hypothetical protein LBT43_22900 [Prevotella sp.]|jgi:hypothetical protein|nr:hypothetical protein [Prevotella sp.]